MFVAPPPVTVPDPIVRERTAYYEIVGAHEEELVREMNRKGPTRPDGTYWAYTDAGTSWSYDAQRVGNTCVLVKPVVLVSINTTLPAWKQPPDVDARVVGKWNTMLSALKKHEGEHAQFARDSANALTELMRSHATDTTCARLNAYLQEHGREINEAEKKRNIDLDARTGHGSSEGVGISW